MQHQTTSVRVEHWRTYDSPTQWLLALDTGLRTSRGYGLGSGLLFARAVVDDFGNLVVVRDWQ